MEKLFCTHELSYIQSFSSAGPILDSPKPGRGAAFFFFDSSFRLICESDEISDSVLVECDEITEAGLFESNYVWEL